MPGKENQRTMEKVPRKPGSRSQGGGQGASVRPRARPNNGSAPREPREPDERRPVTLLGILVRLLPVWALLIMVLILEPTLPFRAAGAVWNRLTAPRPTPTVQVSEPVFIVEEAVTPPASDDLPVPNWDLEISSVFMPGVQFWAESIARWSLQYRIKPNLIATLMQLESCGDPSAVGEDGTRGLFQVAPDLFLNGDAPDDPDTNARRGLEYFAGIYASANGDLGLALAAYNAGPEVLVMSPSEWPSEAQYYQFWGGGIYEEAEMGLRQSPTLLDWLDVGGAELCDQAAGTLNLSQAGQNR
jgi:hypothetical protein